MTKHKHFKRRIRERMKRTGESYTTARLELLAAGQASVAASPPPRAPGRIRFRAARLSRHARGPLGLRYMAPAFAIVISLAIGVVGFLTLTATPSPHSEDVRLVTEVEA